MYVWQLVSYYNVSYYNAYNLLRQNILPPLRSVTKRPDEEKTLKSKVRLQLLTLA